MQIISPTEGDRGEEGEEVRGVDWGLDPRKTKGNGEQRQL